MPETGPTRATDHAHGVANAVRIEHGISIFFIHHWVDMVKRSVLEDSVAFQEKIKIGATKKHQQKMYHTNYDQTKSFHLNFKKRKSFPFLNTQTHDNTSPLFFYFNIRRQSKEHTCATTNSMDLNGKQVTETQ